MNAPECNNTYKTARMTAPRGVLARPQRFYI